MSVKVKMSIIKDIIIGATNYGANLDEICRQCAIDKSLLDEGEVWVELDQAISVWEQAVLLTQNEHLGLHIGQNANPYVIGIIGYLIECAPDVFTALDNICRFNETFADMFRYHYESKPEAFYLYYSPAKAWWSKSPETARQAIETSMLRTLSIIKKFTGRTVFPQKAIFNYPCPGNLDLYKKMLKAELEFSGGFNALLFDEAALKLPVASHNQTLYRQFERIALNELESLKNKKELSQTIRRQLFTDFDQQLPSIENIAERLGLSVRTLQRKLKSEGHTYQEITDLVRKDMAFEFLKGQNNSIDQIAAFLGYADPSVFRRAFKRWTGMTPKEFGNLN